MLDAIGNCGFLSPARAPNPCLTPSLPPSELKGLSVSLLSLCLRIHVITAAQ